MDLIKIGNFIADCRKKKKITQEQLAEKLYVTDRAVSKWERGLSLPDADKMLELCNILDINVNELLNGERIDMKDYNKKTEKLLIEMTKQGEIKNFGKIVEIVLIILTLISLIINALQFTNNIYDCFYDTSNLNSFLISTPFTVLLWVDNLLIYLVSIFYIIDTIQQKKNMFLKLSFCLFSILTTIGVSVSIINFVASLFGVF